MSDTNNEVPAYDPNTHPTKEVPTINPTQLPDSSDTKSPITQYDPDKHPTTEAPAINPSQKL